MEDNQIIIKVSDDLLMELLRFKSENPEFTCYLRQRDTSKRLTNGQWFQGSHYIFCPLFKRADGLNQTKNIGFVSNFNSNGKLVGQYIEVLKRGKNHYSKSEVNLLNDITEWLSIKWTGKETDQKAQYYFEDINFNQNLNFYLTDFREKCLELIIKNQLENAYLVTDKEFSKSLLKVATCRENLGLLKKSNEVAFRKWHKNIYTSDTWKTKKSALTSSLIAYLSSKEIIGEITSPLEIYFSIFYVDDVDFVESLIQQIIKFNAYIPKSPKSEDSKRQLKTGLEHYLNFLKDQALNENKTNTTPKNMDKLNLPLNQILYGPPGTGKTYKTTTLAVQIAEPEKYKEIMNLNDTGEIKRTAIKELYDELVNSKRIAFTTFHQSYSYEDFVEGIRVDNDDDSNIRYRVESGVFKSIVTLANGGKAENPNNTNTDITNRNIWKMSLGDTSKGAEKYHNCIEKGYVGMNYGRDIDFTQSTSRDDIIKLFAEIKKKVFTTKSYEINSVYRFKNEMKIGDIIVVTEGNKKYRAIGEITDEYEFNLDDEVLFFQTRKVKWLKVFKESLPREPLFKKGISQMTLYKLNDESINREHLNELLNKSTVIKNHVLIIDEINRGNISKVFGELITLLEPDKRDGASDQRFLLLPYSKGEFSVPQNLYLIGTMNTADKSLAQMDLALRRRFDFIEMLPDNTLLDDLNVFNLNVADLLRIINQRIEVLLDRDHLIGHSYFWSLKALENQSDLQTELANIFKRKIIPLLQEYFFADWERIRWVLNDQNKAKEHQLIHMQEGDSSLVKLFDAEVADQLSDKRYQINAAAFSLEETYKGILVLE